MDESRRKLLRNSLWAFSLAQCGLMWPGSELATTVEQGNSDRVSPGKLPLCIASANGVAAVTKAMEVLRGKGDTLDAVIAGVNIVELDPHDNSVGYGGLPNENGDVELDASVMHGPTRRAGAVGALRGVKTPSNVAKTVMERTDHILIVGQGAREFATAEGYENVNLLTEESRIAWLRWKETHSEKWGPSHYVPEPASTGGRKELEERRARASYGLAESYAGGDPEVIEGLLAWADEVVRKPPTGTINCLAINEARDISGVTTTSGLAWKIPGRLGDSPLIGCGLYVDNDTGAAGSTGRGEEVIYANGSRMVVEYMRRGASPEQACLDALKLITGRYGNKTENLKDVDVNFYALNKSGQYAGAAIWSHEVSSLGQKRRKHFAVDDGKGGRLVESSYLFERR